MSRKGMTMDILGFMLIGGVIGILGAIAGACGVWYWLTRSGGWGEDPGEELIPWPPDPNSNVGRMRKWSEN